MIWFYAENLAWPRVLYVQHETLSAIIIAGDRPNETFCSLPSSPYPTYIFLLLSNSLTMHTSEYDYLFKLLLIGNSGVGKVRKTATPSLYFLTFVRLVLPAPAVRRRHIHRELYQYNWRRFQDSHNRIRREDGQTPDCESLLHSSSFMVTTTRIHAHQWVSGPTATHSTFVNTWSGHFDLPLVSLMTHCLSSVY